MDSQFYYPVERKTSGRSTGKITFDSAASPMSNSILRNGDQLSYYSALQRAKAISRLLYGLQYVSLLQE